MCHGCLTSYNQIKIQVIFHSKEIFRRFNRHFFACGFMKFWILYSEKSLLLPLNFGFCYTTQDRQAQTPTRVGGLKSSWVLVDFQSSPFCGKTMGSKHNLSRITNRKKSYISPKKTAVWNRPLMNLAHFFLGLHIMKLEVHVCSQPLTLLALF